MAAGVDRRRPRRLIADRGSRPWLPQDDASVLLTAVQISADLTTQLPVGRPTDIDACGEYVAQVLNTPSSAVRAVVLGGVAVGDVLPIRIEHDNQTAWASYWLATGARGQGLAAPRWPRPHATP